MKTIPIFLILLLAASKIIAQEPDSISDLFKMRDAERSFAQASVMIGRNAAFVENFAVESVIFTDKWITNGKQFWKERKVTPLVLKWEPEFMDIAESRDFGISTGPWDAQEYRPYTTPLATGYFLTVWKKQPDGEWNVILDAGSPTPAMTDYDHPFSFPAGADKAIPDPKKLDTGTVCNELLEREKQIISAWKNNPVPSTYASFLAPNVRIQLNGHLPTTNRDTIRKWTGHFDKLLTWITSGSGAATSGDLGFTYGMLETGNEIKRSTGHYVRIWRKQPDKKWAIILEMMNMD